MRTFSAAEMGWLLSALATSGTLRAQAATAPVRIDLTGGLGAVGDLHAAVAPLAAELRERADHARRRAELDGAARAPSPRSRRCRGPAPTPRRSLAARRSRRRTRRSIPPTSS